MTTYERTLIAHGVSPEAARRDALANELVRLTNREHPAYGVQDETIYGGGAQARTSGDMCVTTPRTEPIKRPKVAERDECAVKASREPNAHASTPSPARHLVALPSRQVVGSYDDDFEQRMREGFRFKYGEASVAG